MTSDKDPRNHPTVLRIEGELTIFRAIELKQALLADPAPLEIDLSGVTEIDTAGVQLLMMAKKAAQRAKRELRLVGHSPVVLEVFELLNVAAYFDDPLLLASRTNATANRPTKTSSARSSNGS